MKIITGHYGSGKSEFAVNYALYMAEKNKGVTLADMDIVNPYFRVRDKSDMLTANGIRVIASNQKNNSIVDVPALDSAIFSVFEDSSNECIIDLGGDPIGAKILGRFNTKIPPNYEMWLVVNANRPETQNEKAVIQIKTSIECESMLSVTGIINNTHMVWHTTEEDIIKGNSLCRKISDITGLPILFNCVYGDVEADNIKRLTGNIFPMNIYLRETWM